MEEKYIISENEVNIDIDISVKWVPIKHCLSCFPSKGSVKFTEFNFEQNN